MNPQIFASLMDQAGAPAHPLIFLILGVVTFALHIAAVAVTLGALLLAVRGMMSADKNARRLAGTMAFTAKAGVGALVVLGVAPLLFVQVVYDPFWYTSNVLSAGWTIGFLFLLMLAEGKNHSSSLRTAKNASVGTCTVPRERIFFLPSFCFSSNFFFRVTSPP